MPRINRGHDIPSNVIDDNVYSHDQKKKLLPHGYDILRIYYETHLLLVKLIFARIDDLVLR